MGVFATRSPFRPNSLGLSLVRLTKIELAHPEFGPVLHVAGADLMDKTPIFDIKPYVPHADCRIDARGGFSDKVRDYRLETEIPQEYLLQLPESKREALKKILQEDPRPAYQKDPERIYGFPFSGFEIKFTVKEGILRVCGIEKSRDR